jgi:glucosamine--fructose-6-phosphate aminotransferase (isomerizing)
MCGIVGYAGKNQASTILLDGLERLEYRGYDSAGIAILCDKKINMKKTKGRIAQLRRITDNGKSILGCIGIGHTRWATHGQPSDVNSHPHLSQDGRFAIVHNGIIENYMSLKNFLTQKGFVFRSDTDTEVIAHLTQYYYKGDITDTVIKVISRLEGSYALGILCTDTPESFIAVRKSSPLVIGFGNDGNLIASDVAAIIGHTKKICYVEDNEIAVLTKESVKIYNTDKEELKKETVTIDWDISVAEKGGYEHFMLKEIDQQPQALRDTILPRIKDGKIILDNVTFTKEELNDADRIYITACGSAYHAGVVGKYIIEKLCRKNVEVQIASEFRYCNPILTKNDIVIIISQSGETADTLEALKVAKRHGARVISIVNVVGSTIANISDDVIYTRSGPEIAVATTKAYSTQLAVLYMLAIYIAHKTRTITDEIYTRYIKELTRLPDLVQEVVNNKEQAAYLASKFYNCHSIFFIGRNLDYAIALEGSLKLKEISYIHSEAYAAGELKHGTISLIEEGSLVVALASYEELFQKTVSNIKEVASRSATVLGITTENHSLDGIADYSIIIPQTEDIFLPSLAVIPLQLFSYYTAANKGCDIDKPRNLAKSVTVE